MNIIKKTKKGLLKGYQKKSLVKGIKMILRKKKTKSENMECQYKHERFKNCPKDKKLRLIEYKKDITL